MAAKKKAAVVVPPVDAGTDEHLRRGREAWLRDARGLASERLHLAELVIKGKREPEAWQDIRTRMVAYITASKRYHEAARRTEAKRGLRPDDARVGVIREQPKLFRAVGRATMAQLRDSADLETVAVRLGVVASYALAEDNPRDAEWLDDIVRDMVATLRTEIVGVHRRKGQKGRLALANKQNAEADHHRRRARALLPDVRNILNNVVVLIAAECRKRGENCSEDRILRHLKGHGLKKTGNQPG